MEQYIIRGGDPLYGEVSIEGAKNAGLPILAASIMTDDEVVIHNLPDVQDIRTMIAAMQDIGASVKWVEKGSLWVKGNGINPDVIKSDAIEKIRASYYFIGALLGKYRKASVALPGGCNIGSRPIDQHIKGFKSLGADVSIEHGIINSTAVKLNANHIFLDMASVGATINIIMAACMADGLTVIENVAKEPHVVDVANFLNSMGAHIRGAGTDVIKIRGVSRLHGTEYAIIPDQIETGTFMFATAAAGGDVAIRNVIPKHMEATTSKLIEIGCVIDEYDDVIRVRRSKKLCSTQVKTQPYPGFPTDLQPQMVATLSMAEGTSIVTESIFENRFKYVDELTKMGAAIHVEGNTAIIEGVSKLTGASLNSLDLRAGAALVIAALCAEGESVVDQIEYIKRGYEGYDVKIRGLGGDMRLRDDGRLSKVV